MYPIALDSTWVWVILYGSQPLATTPPSVSCISWWTPQRFSHQRFWWFHRIGWWENLHRKPSVFPWKRWSCPVSIFPTNPKKKYGSSPKIEVSKPWGYPDGHHPFSLGFLMINPATIDASINPGVFRSRFSQQNPLINGYSLWHIIWTCSMNQLESKKNISWFDKKLPYHIISTFIFFCGDFFIINPCFCCFSPRNSRLKPSGLSHRWLRTRRLWRHLSGGIRGSEKI